MERKTKNKLIIGGVIAVIVIWAISGYNGLVNKDEKVSSTASQIENQCKRRADLISNLVETVKGATQYESDVLVRVTEARTAALNEIKGIDLNNATPEQMKVYFDAQAQLQEQSKALQNELKVVVEAYPELKAVENFAKLQDELSGSENRISQARRDWIKATEEYNKSRRRFPNSILASLFGFDARQYYSAPEADLEKPVVQF